jgi:hypothetical protein
MKQSALPGLGVGADPSVGMSSARLDEVMQRRYAAMSTAAICRAC